MKNRIFLPILFLGIFLFSRLSFAEYRLAGGFWFSDPTVSAEGSSLLNKAQYEGLDVPYMRASYEAKGGSGLQYFLEAAQITHSSLQRVYPRTEVRATRIDLALSYRLLEELRVGAVIRYLPIRVVENYALGGQTSKISVSQKTLVPMAMVQGFFKLDTDWSIAAEGKFLKSTKGLFYDYFGFFHWRLPGATSLDVGYRSEMIEFSNDRLKFSLKNKGPFLQAGVQW